MHSEVTLLFYSVTVDQPNVQIEVGGRMVLGDPETYWHQYDNASAAFIVHGDDFALTGSGTIDGGGAAWWPLRDEGAFRPHMVDAHSCQRLLVHGVTFLS